MAKLIGPELLGSLPTPNHARTAVDTSTLGLLNRDLFPIYSGMRLAGTDKGRQAVDGIVGTAHPAWRKRVGCAAVAIVLIGIGTTLVHTFFGDTTCAGATSPAAAASGLTIFAVFFVVALSIERLLEPIASALDITGKKDEAGKALVEAKQQVEQLARTSPEVIEAEEVLTSSDEESPRPKQAASDKVQAAATALRDVSDWTFYRSVIFWAVATVLGVCASAAMEPQESRMMTASLRFLQQDSSLLPARSHCMISPG